MFFYTGMKLGPSHPYGITQIEGAWEKGCGREYLDLRGRKWRENGESYINKNLIICSLHHLGYY